ncbi:MAG: biopolymer transporter ExbD [Proteobacteria bacterium]|nr:biopolymer transporter ExbD [Pseudomonadota bacterium]
MAGGNIGFDKSSGDDLGGDFAEINVIPLVDVLLVLLIIFMVAAPISIGGINIDLPSSKAKGTLSDEDRIVVTISQKGDYFIDKTEIPPSALPAKLKAVYQYRDKKEIFIRADKSVLYSSVVDAMSAARLAGVTRISMLTQPPKG